MEKLNIFGFLCIFAILTLSEAQNCDQGWVAYKDQKCFKLLNQLTTLADAETLCRAEVGTSSDIHPLLTIKSLEEQDLVSQFVFVTSQIVDSVWIGAHRVTGGQVKFQWADGTALDYTNWHFGSPSTILGNDCTQMVPKGLKGQMRDTVDGKWTDASCQKRNLVVCQKLQAWSMPQLQKMILDLTQQVEQVKLNPVPLGFVYVQLPNQIDAKTAWPDVTWVDVTSQYAGLFFRAEGGNSAQFGTTQGDATRQITAMDYTENKSGYPTPLMLPTSGWSQYGRGGGFYTSGSDYFYEGLRFETSSTEVRPQNTAVRIWARVA